MKNYGTLFEMIRYEFNGTPTTNCVKDTAQYHSKQATEQHTGN